MGANLSSRGTWLLVRERARRRRAVPWKSWIVMISRRREIHFSIGGRLAKRSGIVRCGMHYSQGKSTRLFEYTFVAVSINSWESATRAIDCVSLKPGGGGGAGSDPEILNDRAPSTRACSLPPPRTHVSRRARTPPRRTPSHYFTGPPYTGILAGLWCRRVYN